MILGCIYEKNGDWSECDPTTNKRTKTKLLKTGNPEVCQPQKIVTKSCVRPNGESKYDLPPLIELNNLMEPNGYLRILFQKVVTKSDVKPSGQSKYEL